MDSRQSKLYFDDTCKVCSVAAERAQKMSGVQLHGVANDTESGFSHEHLMKEIHLVDSDGSVHKGADAVIELLARSRGWKWFAPVLRLPGVHSLAVAFYRFVAKHRHLP
ncbi:hypothetical protein A3H16_00855 [Candidatus Kaiserbacteria bacterium RIFCSPLOWO2_12_FULL_53_8]|uniref:Thiol-disulfide oxidoreductase n=2 Tax=Candidatus Kaiseribacteriota TaxID=1752734 RepID=A0A1F6CYE0_9BACT|nr:MAG: hypothetical protein A2851_00780 [Candidatus Kaiserbacteria bacterium RIFCSPHIGHO2_01_FULL_53_29]OGG92106.1 MAG: hypothetical protein A3H16_00855 [Candidatus Kaiserbacteria bacterium RIFCSPLOWO2_12_FULL_53_8]